MIILWLRLTLIYLNMCLQLIFLEKYTSTCKYIHLHDLRSHLHLHMPRKIRMKCAYVCVYVRHYLVAKLYIYIYKIEIRYLIIRSSTVNTVTHTKWYGKIKMNNAPFAKTEKFKCLEFSTETLFFLIDFLRWQGRAYYRAVAIYSWL